MFLSTLKVLFQHKYQAIKNVDIQKLPAPFRGRPELTAKSLDNIKLAECVKMCPTGAISAAPFTLDMGKCIFCGECERMMPDNIHFTQSWYLWSLTREGLVVKADDPELQIRKKEHDNLRFKKYRRAIKLRQVCAGGDGACETELGAAGNVNFDMRRFGIEFTASPRHSDAVVLTGAITKAMSEPLKVTFAALPEPKMLIAVGADAISGGLFVDSPAIDRSFLDEHKPNLYVAGHPSHPFAIIGGIRDLIGDI